MRNDDDAIHNLGAMPKVIIFCFAGRKANMALQVPFIEAIVEANPNTSAEIWNLSKVKSDGEYLKELKPSSKRIKVRHEYFGLRPWRDNLDKVWQHYTNPKYKDCLFVKLDDDIIWIETARFGDFIDAVDAHRGAVVSANVVNNGACMRTFPNLWARFEPLRLPILEVHRHKKFAEFAHRAFIKDWRDMVDMPVNVVGPIIDWLSINAIGFDWNTLCDIASRIGSPSPREISGRGFPLGMPVGDEGAVNMGDRFIMQGFTVSHLTFGPQNIPEPLACGWRRFYSRIQQEYLGSHAPIERLVG